MRALLLLLLILPQALNAQQFRGRVFDAASGEAISHALITNVRSGALWLSDSLGNAAFTAFPGDIIRFEHTGYKAYTRAITTYADAITIPMDRAPIELRGVQVRSPLARYREDSIFNRQFFHKELSYAHSQVSLGGATDGIGIGAGGLVSELALIVSGKRKSARRLQEEMLFLEGMQYAAIRYTSSLVSAQTGLQDSAAAAFILRNPIPNEYLRAASETELKMRIRETFRAERKTDSLKAITR